MLRSLTLILCLAAVPAAAAGLKINVTGAANGQIEIDLLKDVAPKHVAQIVALAEAGFYDGVYFHRVIDGFMAQTGDGEFARVGSGDRSGWGRGGSELPDIPAEFSEIPFDRGVVGMARAAHPDSANSQFFIMFEPGYFLNGNYTVIGRVTSGFEVLDAITRGDPRTGAIVGTPDWMEQVEVTE